MSSTPFYSEIPPIPGWAHYYPHSMVLLLPLRCDYYQPVGVLLSTSKHIIIASSVWLLLLPLRCNYYYLFWWIISSSNRLLTSRGDYHQSVSILLSTSDYHPVSIYYYLVSIYYQPMSILPSTRESIITYRRVYYYLTESPLLSTRESIII